MAAYAVLISLRHIIEHLQNHPRPPISLDQNLTQSLIQNVTFLQEFLEGYSEYSDALESRIADAAYAAEDLIESHIVDQIQAHGEKISSVDELYQSLKKVIQDMDLITREVTNVKEKTRIQHQPQKKSSASSGLLRSLPMVGFNDVLIETMDKLTGHRSSRQVIPIVGMGGIGIFPEDGAINISRLIKLWVAEGFLKPIRGKSLEVAGEEYLQDLVDRNLILVHKLGLTGKIEYCKIHDLLRDACLKEAHKDKFLCFKSPHDGKIPQDIQSQRRAGFRQSTGGKFFGTLQSASLRSLICNSNGGARYSSFLGCRLLRVLIAGKNYDKQECYSLETIFQRVNSRYLEAVFRWNPRIPSSVDQFWNLQTLVIKKPHWNVVVVPVEMWKMPQLRHVMIDKFKLPDPPPVDGECDFVVLENLQTLSVVRNFKCSEEVVKRIPLVKKLEIYYDKHMGSTGTCFLENLCRLCKLESLSCEFDLLSEARHSSQHLSFPYSLNELTLEGTWLRWEDMTMTGIGLLPHLQVLSLHNNSFIGSEWETVGGQFPSLKCLKFSLCDELEYWRTESTHFPCLEHLVLWYMINLKEIPLEIGDIPTMKSIELKYCTDSSVASAKRMRDEQKELGNVGFRVNYLR